MLLWSNLDVKPTWLLREAGNSAPEADTLEFHQTKKKESCLSMVVCKKSSSPAEQRESGGRNISFSTDHISRGSEK